MIPPASQMPRRMTLAVTAWALFAIIAGLVAGVLADLSIGGNPYLWWMFMTGVLMLAAVTFIARRDYRRRRNTR